jgi:hypothetical protein
MNPARDIRGILADNTKRSLLGGRVMAILWVLWLLFGAVCAFLAKEKNRSVSSFFVCGLLLGPIGLVIALCAKRWYYDDRLGIVGSMAYLEKTWDSLSPDERALYDEDDDEQIAPAESISEEVRRLATLHKDGALTDGEFRAAKARALGL